METEQFRERVKTHYRTKTFERLKELNKLCKGSVLKFHSVENNDELWVDWFLFDVNGREIANMNSFFEDCLDESH